MENDRRPGEDETLWKANFERLLTLLPVLEEPDFVPALWPDRGVVMRDGVECRLMPYPEYNPVLEQVMFKLVSHLGPEVHPYDPLPEDPTQDGIPFNVRATHFTPEYFTNATDGQVRRYLRLCLRGERFCDGHIDAEFRSGAILAALRRLKELRDQRTQ